MSLPQPEGNIDFITIKWNEPKLPNNQDTTTTLVGSMACTAKADQQQGWVIEPVKEMIVEDPTKDTQFNPWESADEIRDKKLPHRGGINNPQWEATEKKQQNKN